MTQLALQMTQSSWTALAPTLLLALSALALLLVDSISPEESGQHPARRSRRPRVVCRGHHDDGVPVRRQGPPTEQGGQGIVSLFGDQDRRRPDVAVLHVHRRQRGDAGRRRQQRLPPRPPLQGRVLHARPAGGDRDEPAREREQPGCRFRQPGAGVAAVVRSRRLPQVEQGERRGGAEVLPRRRAVVGGVRLRHLAGVRRDRRAPVRRRRDGHRRGRADGRARRRHPDDRWRCRVQDGEFAVPLLGAGGLRGRARAHLGVPLLGLEGRRLRAGVPRLHHRLPLDVAGAAIDWTGLVFQVLAIVTMFVGNFAAATQEKVKRMLAYSSIGHAGYVPHRPSRR